MPRKVAAGAAAAAAHLSAKATDANVKKEDDSMLLRRNLQLTRAKLSLQVAALAEAEKTIDLLTEALAEAEKAKADADKELKQVEEVKERQNKTGELEAVRQDGKMDPDRRGDTRQRQDKVQRRKRQKEQVEIALALHDLCTSIELLLVETNTSTSINVSPRRNSATQLDLPTENDTESRTQQTLPQRAEVARKTLLSFVKNVENNEDKDSDKMALENAQQRINELEIDIEQQQNEIFSMKSKNNEMRADLDIAVRNCKEKDNHIEELNSILEDRTEKLISLTFCARHVVSAMEQNDSETFTKSLTMQSLFNNLSSSQLIDSEQINDGATSPLPSFEDIDSLCKGLSGLLRQAKEYQRRLTAATYGDTQDNSNGNDGSDNGATMLKRRLRRQAQEQREENLYEEIEIREAELVEYKQQLEDYKDQLAVMNFEKKMALAAAQREQGSGSHARSPSAALAPLGKSGGRLNQRKGIFSKYNDEDRPSELADEIKELRAMCEEALHKRNTSTWQDRNAAVVSAALLDTDYVDQRYDKAGSKSRIDNQVIDLDEVTLLNSEKMALFSRQNTSL